VTLTEFAREIISVAMTSSICDVPSVRRLTLTAMNLRVPITTGGFVDAFYNEQTGTMAFAFIRRGQRVFGADNTGGWHVHPFASPGRHDPLPEPMAFAAFMVELERRASVNNNPGVGRHQEGNSNTHES
jgi:hypothetical protein